MGLKWTDARDARFRDAYLDWSDLLTRRRAALPPAQPDSGQEYEPIFVRLVGPGARTGLIAALADGSGRLLMDGHEYAELTARAAPTDALAGLPDEYALYRRLGTSDAEFAALFEVLDTGVPVVISDAASPAAPVAPAPANPQKGAPIIAVVDDGIGFLNARFRRQAADGTQTSRFHALWLQSLEQRGPGGGVLLGETLSQTQITALLAQPECAAYAALNDRLFKGEARQITGFSTTHGTHILDLAAGADPAGDDAVRDWPLLAVQLPPQAIEDTSGTRFESYMVQAVRWILRRAGEIDKTAPVIVNLSLGVLAGPKDGSRFVEYQIAREAAEWERVTGQPVRIVWSFGNDHQGHLVARFKYKAADNRKRTDRDITWRVQPCDQTPSYLELRLPRRDMGDLQVALTAPDGTTSGFGPLAPGQLRSLEQDGQAIARLYHVPARDFGTGVVSPAHVVLALAPTEARKQAEPEAPSGAWRVTLRHEGPEALEPVLQIQRDDALRGYRAQARQSYFDDADAHDWNPEAMDYGAYAPGCPITHEGTHSAMATAPARQVFCVAAAAHRGGPQGDQPARYSAQGAPWSVPGPTAAVSAQDGVFHRGLLASGTLSGSARAIGGTSAAAARLTRALGHSAKRIVKNAGKGRPSADLDPARIDLLAVEDGKAARLGDYLVQLRDLPPRMDAPQDKDTAPLVG
ncbi:S8/S53 family peptidase [Tropicibacter oceani]|uniref:Peptidase S8/S53 domain-containing protein n=1 Tax=Tropicibacter oceani TaxID=3058420 RepID=A0ABY8QLI8_9RHOB|nr:hypothetical protein [Tropicibacter oceani]WGW05424.1 hypothetical protein QF118_07720 [Tropicibacter oceani]